VADKPAKGLFINDQQVSFALVKRKSVWLRSRNAKTLVKNSGTIPGFAKKEKKNVKKNDTPGAYIFNNKSYADTSLFYIIHCTGPSILQQP